VTVSASTPRVRLTHALLLAIVLLHGLSYGRSPPAAVVTLLGALGFLCVMAAILWRLWASLFIAGRKDVELVTAGPYAQCRHPLYLGTLVGVTGIALATGSVVLLLVVPALFFSILNRAIVREEAFLAARHAMLWPPYVRRTPPLWPRPWPRFDRPPSGTRVDVDVPVFRKAILDAGGWCLLYLLLLLAPTLRAWAGVPALFRLP